MHRSRLTVLVIFAAAAACTTHDDATGTDLLAQDRTLVARLENDRDVRPAPLPSACGVVTAATTPAAASVTQAKELTLQAQGEEMKGNIAEARTLLVRAAALDGTNKSTAYHLGRTSEALGDSAAAMRAFCRYLALTPSTAESAEARQRVAELSRSVTRVAGGSVTESVNTAVRSSPAATRRVSHATSRVASRPMPRATVVQSAISTAPARGASTPTPGPREHTVPDADAAGGAMQTEVGAASDPVATVDAPPSAPSTARRGPTRAQGAIFGAATGAIIGAATGRSVKSAVIGAAAGGILGTVVGRGGRPLGPSIR